MEKKNLSCLYIEPPARPRRLNVQEGKERMHACMYVQNELGGRGARTNEGHFFIVNSKPVSVRRAAMYIDI
jgi:hypothetical protein